MGWNFIWASGSAPKFMDYWIIQFLMAVGLWPSAPETTPLHKIHLSQQGCFFSFLENFRGISDDTFIQMTQPSDWRGSLVPSLQFPPNQWINNLVMELTLYYSHRYLTHTEDETIILQGSGTLQVGIWKGDPLGILPSDLIWLVPASLPSFHLVLFQLKHVSSHIHITGKCFLTGVPRHFFTVSIVCLLTHTLPS